MKNAMRYAKAIIAFAIPAGLFVADVGAQWQGWAADDTITSNEWLLLAIAVASGIGVYFKSNAPPA